MPESDQERVTCPGCGKGYRFQKALAGREVPCKQCGGAFIIPDQPGLGLAIVPAQAEDDGLYDLASDPDEDRDLPPAHVVKTPKSGTSEPTPAVDTGKPLAPDPTDQAYTSEPQVHISEAAKASRREEQRIAAANAVTEKSWRSYKWLFILLAVGILIVCVMWALNRFDEFMQDPTKQSFFYDRDEVLFAFDHTEPSQ